VNVGWLIVALLAAFFVIGIYVWSIASRRRRLERRIEELDRSGR